MNSNPRSPAPMPKPGSRAPVVPEYISPEVAADGRVTIRYYNPQAREVWCEGEWADWQPMPLRRGADGQWAATTEPLAPGLYEYSLFADGARVIDYQNGAMKNRFAHLVEVPGGGLQEVRDVPHGAVHAHWYRSAATGEARRMFVYTPPGYDESRKYPVLFLLHGAGDDEESWLRVGRANFILDNLISEGQAVPMIVAMPNGHTLGTNWKERRAEKVAAFVEEFYGQVSPLVEGSYAVDDLWLSWAIAGLSMGGGQAIATGMARPGEFKAVGIFSAGLWPEIAPMLEPALPVLAESVRPLLWIGIGRRDFLYGHCADLRQVLDREEIPYTYHEDGSGHTWTTWRDYLARFLPLLFRKP